MEIDIITKEDARIRKAFEQIAQIKDQIIGPEENSPILFNGERYLTDADLAEKLFVSRRTLQDWRNLGIIGYIKIRGKLIYRESDIRRLLRENYRDIFKKS